MHEVFLWTSKDGGMSSKFERKGLRVFRIAGVPPETNAISHWHQRTFEGVKKLQSCSSLPLGRSSASTILSTCPFRVSKSELFRSSISACEYLDAG